MRSPRRGSADAVQALRDLEEQAQTLATRAQAALLDEHKDGALRSFQALHELLIPRADAWVAAQVAGLEGDKEQAVPELLSSATGLLGLWRELPDLDCNRDSVIEALLRQAAQADGVEEAGVEAGTYALALDAETLARQVKELQEQLRAEPLPRSHYFRRLARRARGGLGDRARVQVQRGALTVLERLPAPDSTAPAHDFTTALGEFQAGDRLTLQWQNPLPGQVAVLHAVGDEQRAELSVLIPQLESESVPRRHHEIIEVVGELSHVPAAFHSLLILWVPELVPPRWVSEVLLRHSLPPDARVWRYRYEVAAAPPSSPSARE